MHFFFETNYLDSDNTTTISCHFTIRKSHNSKTLQRIIKKFQNERIVHNINKGRSGRTRGARIPESIDTVRLSGVAQGLKKSCQ